MEFEEIIANGIVYRLPERGIKLDFMAAVYRYVFARRPIPSKCQTDCFLRMREKENFRKRVSEVGISEEPPKRMRHEDHPVITLPAEDAPVISALLQLKVPPVVTASPGLSVILERLLVCDCSIREGPAVC
jgi:hypothetical protein